MWYAPAMTMVLRPGESAEDLVAAGDGGCPRCGGSLRPWGHARARAARGPAGEWWYRPQRVRCSSCRATQVVLPPEVLLRRRDGVAVVGAAWRSCAGGVGVRRTAVALGLPMETVRGWMRRLRDLVGTLHAAPGERDPARLHRGLARRTASARAAGWVAEDEVWRFASHGSQGRLLARNTSWPYALAAEAPMT